MTLKSFIPILIILFFCSNLTTAQSLNNPIVDSDVVFQEIDGVVAVEAGYFYKQSKSEIRQWYITAKDKAARIARMRSYISPIRNFSWHLWTLGWIQMAMD